MPCRKMVGASQPLVVGDRERPKKQGGKCEHEDKDLMSHEPGCFRLGLICRLEGDYSCTQKSFKLDITHK